MARRHQDEAEAPHHPHGHDRQTLFDERHRGHSERFDRDPRIARSLGSGADMASQSGSRYEGPERRRNDHGRPQYESGGYDPHGGQRPRPGSGYGGYGETPGEGAGGYDSGRNYAAEPGWGPGYGERPEQDARFGRSMPQAAAGERRESLSRRSVHSQGAASEEGRHASQSRGARARRGPKGYERSDERLKEDVCERLMWAEDIDASEVSVDVNAGVVVLEGAVPERRMKHAIEDLVDACLGVKDIENRIKVTYGEHREVHAEEQQGKSSPRASVGTPSGSGISGMSDSSSSGGAATGGRSD